MTSRSSHVQAGKARTEASVFGRADRDRSFWIFDSGRVALFDDDGNLIHDYGFQDGDKVKQLIFTLLVQGYSLR